MTSSRTVVRFVFTGALAAALIFVASAATRLRADGQDEALIVQCTRPCAAVIGAVSALGGKVTYQYESIDAVAVRIPKVHVADLALVTGATAIKNPMPGRWTAILIGFTIHRHDGKPEDPAKENGRTDVFSLTATADGVRLKARR